MLHAAPGSLDPTLPITEIARGFSIECTRPSADDVAQIADVLPPGTRVYLSALPGRSPLDDLPAAAMLRGRGLEPVLHVAVRNYANAAALDAVLSRFAGEAGLACVLVIAGDIAHPAGSLHSARDAIDSGVFKRRGIVEIGIAGYPEGHPRLPAPTLERALTAKIEAAAATGLAVHVVTQFGFDAAPIVDWIARLRAFGIEAPVRIGLAGPTSLSGLLRYAKRCGVKTSAQALARQAGLVRQIFSMTTPDTVIRPLAQARAEGRLGEVALHLFSFGGAPTTARWMAAVAAGKFQLAATGGFHTGCAT